MIIRQWIKMKTVFLKSGHLREGGLIIGSFITGACLYLKKMFFGQPKF